MTESLIPAVVFAPLIAKHTRRSLQPRAFPRRAHQRPHLQHQGSQHAGFRIQAWLEGRDAAQLQSALTDLAHTYARRCLTCAVGVALAVSLGAGASSPALASALLPGTQIASAAEDNVLEAARQLEARLDNAMRAISGMLPSTSDPKEAAAADQEGHELIREVWEVVAANFLDARHKGFDQAEWKGLRDRALQQPLRDRGSAYGLIRDMLARGTHDHYTRFITPSEFSAMLKYDVTGVGLNLGTRDEFQRKTNIELPPMEAGTSGESVWVLGMIKGSAADAAGLVQGDQVLEVNGVRVGADGVRSPFQVASLIQGQDTQNPAAPSQKVAIKVRRLDGRVEEVGVDRPTRVLSSPLSYKLEKRPSPATGYIRLSSFTSRAQQDMASAIKELQRRGARRLVLDLRDNPGGLVNEGIEVAKLFLDDGALVVRTEGNSRLSSAAVTALGEPSTSLPLTVLVNEHTASASEILAGALQDNCRAVLVGRRTYGKGLIQSVYELHDSSGLVLTVGKYLTPRGTDIDRTGIRPDFKSIPDEKGAQQALAACKIKPAVV